MHYQGLCRFAVKYVEDFDQAEDIVQNVFVKILNNWEEQRFHTSKHSYLFQAVKNACFNHNKHLKIKASYLDHNQRERSLSEKNIEERDQAQELTSILMKEIDALPEQCGKIFKMSKLEGLKYKEIADQLNLSVKTIENQMGKALKVLRLKMKEYSDIPIEIILLKIAIGVSTISVVLDNVLVS